MKKLVLNKKGVSPMIATILLIAMVIVIAMIIFLWFKNMTQEAITKFGDENIELTCDKVEISAEYSAPTLSVVNDGNVPLYGLKVKIYREDGNKEISIDKSTDPTKLSAGINQGGSYTKDISSDVSGATKIVIYPVLIGNSDSGTRTFICSNNGIERSL